MHRALCLLAVVYTLSITVVSCATPSQRAHALLAQMTQAEKITMLHGSPLGGYVGNVPGNARLGIPALNLNDGPQGFRGNPGTSTCWPSGLTVAASWNRTALGAWGVAMGQEFVGKGANVQLGPGVCVARVPVNGRNFEYLSGEDPFLGYTLVQPVIQGIQSQGVIANVKHFIGNNQETNRDFVSANVDERTLWEIYMPPFAGAVEAGVLSLMCSYNRVNDTYACENPFTLNASLKGALGFQGWVMSDWGATHSTVGSAVAGLDQEMPVGLYFGDALELALAAGDITQSIIDDKVLRILTSMYTAGLFDVPNNGSLSANVTSSAHNALARELSGDAIVLLKNSGGALPIASNVTRIAVLGNACETDPIVAGGGSGAVTPPYIITALQGIKARAGSNVNVTYGGTTPVATAVSLAQAADIAIVCTATTSSEGFDRVSLALPDAENELITAVAAAQPNTVVVVTSPGAVLLPWISNVAAAIATFLPGQEAGNAVADVLFGDVNPSGRLPLTFPLTENPTNFSEVQYPGLPSIFPLDANYSEGLLIGYRWYDLFGVAPLYPFGHGLSYTTFKYSNLVTSSTNITAVVTNTGSNEPPQVLKGFQKVFVSPQSSVAVSFPLMAVDKSVYDPTEHRWVEQYGTFGVYVGASSRDIRLKGTFMNTP